MTSPLWLSEIGAERREIGVRKLNSNDQMYLYPSLRNPLCTSEYQQVSGLGFGSRLPQQVFLFSTLLTDRNIKYAGVHPKRICLFILR